MLSGLSGLLLLSLAGCGGPDLPAGAPAPGSAGPWSGSSSGPGGTGPGQSVPGPSVPGPGTGGQPSPGGSGSSVPTEAELAAARTEVAALPLPRLAAQLLVVRQPGLGEAAAGPVRRLGAGGVAAFADAVPSRAADIPGTVRRSNQAVQRAMRDSGRVWPAFIAVDQEGGPVVRIGSPLTRWPAAMALGATRDPDLVRRVTRAAGAELRDLGFTAVLAPVADVTSGPSETTIGSRSPGSDPGLVAEVALAAARGYLDSGLVPTIKHFPGHGGVSGDSHRGTVRQGASRRVLNRRDLVPFRRAVDAGMPALMTAHIVLAAVDAGEPATLSAPVLGGLLRREWGYRGLVVTDALEMAAVAGRYGSAEAATRAVAAGADVLLMPADPDQAVAGLVGAVRAGRVSRQRLEESAARMVATLRHTAAGAGQGSPERGAGRPPDGHPALADQLARASITQLSGPCGRRLVGSAVRISGGSPADRAVFTQAAKEAGLPVRPGRSSTSVALLGAGGYRAGSGGDARPGTATGQVVVSLDTPYGLASAGAATTRLAAYGSTPATARAVVSVLLGRAVAPGRLPVAVGRWPVGSGCR